MNHVLYVLPVPGFFSQFDGVGGHVAHVYGIVQGLIEAGYRVDLVGEETPPDFLLGQGCEARIYPLKSRNLLNRQLWGPYLIRKLKLGLITSLPCFCYMRYSAGFSPWIPLLKKALGDIPLVLEVNSFGTQYHPWMRWLDLKGMQAADLIICVSEEMMSLVVNRLSSRLAEKAIILPNAVNPERFNASNQVADSKDGVKIGYLGILKPDYGLETLLEGFQIVHSTRRDVSLHVYGAGPLRNSLEPKIKLIPDAYLHDAVPFIEVPAVMHGLDILVYTTTNTNSFQSPIKLYEYMAAGKPIIAARTPQVERVLGNETRGLLFEPGDANGLAFAVYRLIDDPGLAKRVSTNALEEVKEKHSWRSRIELLLRELGERSLISV